jgi:hypothetical protein
MGYVKLLTVVTLHEEFISRQHRFVRLLGRENVIPRTASSGSL